MPGCRTLFQQVSIWLIPSSHSSRCSNLLNRACPVHIQFSSVQSLSHVWLCDPINCRMPGIPVHHQLPEFTQTHVHRVCDAIQPSHPLSSPSPPGPNPVHIIYMQLTSYGELRISLFFKFLLTVYHCLRYSYVLVTQSCPTLCYPMDCSPPGSSVHGISQVRILEWVAISFSRGSSQPRDQTQTSCITGRFFTILYQGSQDTLSCIYFTLIFIIYFSPSRI